MDNVMRHVHSPENPGVFSVGSLEVASVRDLVSVVILERGLARMGRQEMAFVSLTDLKFCRNLRD